MTEDISNIDINDNIKSDNNKDIKYNEIKLEEKNKEKNENNNNHINNNNNNNHNNNNSNNENNNNEDKKKRKRRVSFSDDLKKSTKHEIKYYRVIYPGGIRLRLSPDIHGKIHPCSRILREDDILRGVLTIDDEEGIFIKLDNKEIDPTDDDEIERKKNALNEIKKLKKKYNNEDIVITDIERWDLPAWALMKRKFDGLTLLQEVPGPKRIKGLWFYKVIHDNGINLIQYPKIDSIRSEELVEKDQLLFSRHKFIPAGGLISYARVEECTEDFALEETKKEIINKNNNTKENDENNDDNDDNDENKKKIKKGWAIQDARNNMLLEAFDGLPLLASISYYEAISSSMIKLPPIDEMKTFYIRVISNFGIRIRSKPDINSEPLNSSIVPMGRVVKCNRKLRHENESTIYYQLDLDDNDDNNGWIFDHKGNEKLIVIEKSPPKIEKGRFYAQALYPGGITIRSAPHVKAPQSENIIQPFHVVHGNMIQTRTLITNHKEKFLRLNNNNNYKFNKDNDLNEEEEWVPIEANGMILMEIVPGPNEIINENVQYQVIFDDGAECLLQPHRLSPKAYRKIPHNNLIWTNKKVIPYGWSFGFVYCEEYNGWIPERNKFGENILIKI